MDKQNNISVKADLFIDAFETAMENNPKMDAAAEETILGIIGSTDELGPALPAFKNKCLAYKELADNCDRSIKEAQAGKKLFTQRAKQFTAILGKLLTRLKVPNESFKYGGIKIATSTRTCLEVDTDWLLAQFDNELKAFEATLPEYISVELSIDKNKLLSFLKTNEDLLLNHPDRVHTKESKSTSIK